jgi:hypothetical protein
MGPSEWEKCKNYGVAIIDYPGQVRLYYLQYSSNVLNLPVGYTAVAANWQGDALIVKALNFEKKIYILRYTGFSQWLFVG